MENAIGIKDGDTNDIKHTNVIKDGSRNGRENAAGTKDGCTNGINHANGIKDGNKNKIKYATGSKDGDMNEKKDKPITMVKKKKGKNYGNSKKYVVISYFVLYFNYIIF